MDPADYILWAGKFWPNKPEWDSFNALSIIFKSFYSKHLTTSLCECAFFSFLTVLFEQVKDCVRHSDFYLADSG